MSLIVAIILLLFLFLLACYQKLRTLRKVNEGPGAYWSFREGQIVGKGRKEIPASGSQLGTCLSPWPGFW